MEKLHIACPRCRGSSGMMFSAVCCLLSFCLSLCFPPQLSVVLCFWECARHSWVTALITCRVNVKLPLSHSETFLSCSHTHAHTHAARASQILNILDVASGTNKICRLFTQNYAPCSLYAFISTHTRTRMFHGCCMTNCSMLENFHQEFS